MGVLPFDEAGAKQPFVVGLKNFVEIAGARAMTPVRCGHLEPEKCRGCHAGGKQVAVRNYLAEGLRIAAGTSSRALERKHLRAVIEHCRAPMGAVMTITEVR